jgi:hypothetical protein
MFNCANSNVYEYCMLLPYLSTKSYVKLQVTIFYFPSINQNLLIRQSNYITIRCRMKNESNGIKTHFRPKSVVTIES